VCQCEKDAFFDNLQLQDAVIRRLLVIAEAARRVSAATRQSLTTIPAAGKSRALVFIALDKLETQRLTQGVGG